MLTLQLLLFSQFMVFILFNIAQETSRIPQGTVTLDNAKKKLTQLILCDNLFFFQVHAMLHYICHNKPLITSPYTYPY